MTKEEMMKLVMEAGDVSDADKSANALKSLGDYYDSNKSTFDTQTKRIEDEVARAQKLSLMITDGVIAKPEKTEEQMDKEAADAVFKSIEQDINTKEGK